MSNFLRFVNTVKYLKFIQIYYRFFYFSRKYFRKIICFKQKFIMDSKSIKLSLQDSIKSNVKVDGHKFCFLNLEHNFNGNIDWNYAYFGKLWTYNLCYFEFLEKQDDVWLVYDFIKKIPFVKDGLEPFPISLRAINWIKFITKFDIKDKKIDDSLYAQYYILLDNLEYHLLGNHLLENGFSLLFGGYYFQDKILETKAKNILINELNRQILSDGAHFELSPMYHQLMLYRLLDVINLIQNNNNKKDSFLDFLIAKASLMLGWLSNITYKNGDIPMLNDSAYGIAPSSLQLFEYADKLNIKKINSELSSSGYRKIVRDRYECIVDIADVKAYYIAGHTHADSLNFELYIDKRPFIVDCGISTYENCKRRLYEKGTISHNTVEVPDKNSSNVWDSFRLANRARIIFLKENMNTIEATHDGYKTYGILHTRIWIFNEQLVIIKDILSKDTSAVFRLHFHPCITKNDICKAINLYNMDYSIKDYLYPVGYNNFQTALVLEIVFSKELEIEIRV